MLNSGIISLLLLLVIGCASSPSDKVISSTFKDYVEKGGNYTVTSLRIVSVEEVGSGQPSMRENPGEKAYVVNAIFSLDTLKDVSSAYAVVRKKGEHVDAEGSFVIQKKEGRWGIVPVKFNKAM